MQNPSPIFDLMHPDPDAAELRAVVAEAAPGAQFEIAKEMREEWRTLRIFPGILYGVGIRSRVHFTLDQRLELWDVEVIARDSAVRGNNYTVDQTGLLGRVRPVEGGGDLSLQRLDDTLLASTDSDDPTTRRGLYVVAALVFLFWAPAAAFLALMGHQAWVHRAEPFPRLDGLEFATLGALVLLVFGVPLGFLCGRKISGALESDNRARQDRLAGVTPAPPDVRQLMVQGNVEHPRAAAFLQAYRELKREFPGLPFSLGWQGDAAWFYLPKHAATLAVHLVPSARFDPVTAAANLRNAQRFAEALAARFP